jgi:methyl-accepting chemotaxis protein
VAFPIRTQFRLFSAAILTLGAAQIILVATLMWNQGNLDRSQESQLLSWKLANELRFSSDELTRTARTYVVTATPAYETEYWRILAVRDGHIPRPDGRPIPLRTLIHQAGATPQEEAKLNEAEDNSNTLVATEVAAFQAMKGRFMPEGSAPTVKAADYTRTAPPDQAYAVRIMHDSKYYADKALIMGPITEFEKMTDQRTMATVAMFRDRSTHLLLASVITAALLAAAALFSYYGAQRPAARAIETVTRQLGDLARGDADLSRRLKIDRDDEIGELARNFNALLANLSEMVGQIRHAASEVVCRGGDILQNMKALEQGIAAQSTSTTETTATTRQISATADDLASTVTRVATSTGTTSEKARQGREGMEQIRDKMNGLLRANDHIVAKLSVISDKTANIGGIVTTISKVADQTQLLSLNAAIEAENAGDAGRGFAVVAQEIRRLADNTNGAAKDIALMIAEVKTAVSSGVMEMDKFGGQVRSSTEEVSLLSGDLTAMAGDVEALAPLLNSVRQGVTQQAEGASAIYEAMDNLSKSMRKTTGDIESAAASLNGLEATGHRLQELLSKFSK